HHRQRFRRPPGRPGGGTAGRDYDIDLDANQFLRDHGQAFRLALGVSLLNEEVPPFDVAEVTQLLAERLDEGMTAGRKPANSDRSRGLTAGKSWPRCYTGRKTASEGTVIHLFNDLIRPRQQRRRDRQAEGLGGLEIDDEFELGGLLHRQIGGGCPPSAFFP